jgi:trigger factor
MITSYVDESPTKKTMRIEIPAEDVGAATESVARSLAREVRLPGFRPGKVPVEIAKKRFAEEIRGEVLERLVQESVGEALKEKGLVPLGKPKIEEVSYLVGAPLSFRVDLEVRPPVHPKDFRGLKVPSESTAPTDADIDGVMERLRDSHAAYEPIEGRPAADGDFALVDISGSYPAGDGKDFEHEKVLVEIGGEKTMPEISANLRNAEPGARATFQKDFPADAQDPDFAGKTVLYTVALHGLKSRRLPDVDDDFARLALTPRDGEPPEGANLESLRQRIRESVERDKVEGLKEKRRRAALDGLLALNDVDAPESMVESEVDSALKEYARFMARQGVDLKEAKLDWNHLREEARPSAVKRVKEYLLLDAIGEQESIVVTDTELDAELRRRAAAMGMPASELRSALAGADRLEGVREELRIDRVVDFLLAEAISAPSA